MNKELKFKEIIENIIGEINEAKRKSKFIHKAGNIKTSGDEVENLIREKISLFLPERYLVKQGHIINSEGKVSNQFDIIIFDRLNTPKFFEASNETVYYPIESVLAVGEIKKTLRSKDPIEFGKKIRYLKEDMQRKLIVNTAFGNKISNSTLIADLINMTSERKFKNPLFSFIFAIDEEKIENLEVSEGHKYMPNDIYVLNYGYYLFGEIKDGTIVSMLEDENPMIKTLIEVKKPGINCIGTLLNQLINHLNKCHIEPFSISNYLDTKTDFRITGSDIKAYTLRK